MQPTLQNISPPRSSISTSSWQSSKGVEVDVGSEFSDSVLSISTPSPSACGSQSLKRPKMYESFSDIRSYDGKNNLF